MATISPLEQGYEIIEPFDTDDEEQYDDSSERDFMN